MTGNEWGCFNFSEPYFFIMENSINLYNNNINIYPTPVSNTLNIQLNNTIILNNARLNIYNSEGQLIYKNAISSENIIIDVSNFNTGLYILMINNNMNECYPYKFIKQ